MNRRWLFFTFDRITKLLNVLISSSLFENVILRIKLLKHLDSYTNISISMLIIRSILEVIIKFLFNVLSHPPNWKENSERHGRTLLKILGDKNTYWRLSWKISPVLSLLPASNLDKHWMNRSHSTIAIRGTPSSFRLSSKFQKTHSVYPCCPGTTLDSIMQIARSGRLQSDRPKK